MSSRIFALLAFCFISLVCGHSQMRCAKYDIATGQCYAPIRNQGQSFDQEASLITNGVCQKPMSNPISASYGNGADCGYAPCPLPMGTFVQGETFTIMWLARNHATADQTPGMISLYSSPVESMTQGTDVSASVFAQNKFCEAPFMSCNGLNGNFVQCYANCTLPPSTPTGIHTLWWKWNWDNHDSIYVTCADVYVVAGVIPSGSGGNTFSSGNNAQGTSTSGAVQGSTSSTSGTMQTSTSSSSSSGQPQSSTSTSTTGSPRPVPSTTGRCRPMTTASTGSSLPVTSTSTTGSSQPVTSTSTTGSPRPMSTSTTGSPQPASSTSTSTTGSPRPMSTSTSTTGSPQPASSTSTSTTGSPQPVTSTSTSGNTQSSTSNGPVFPLPCVVGDQICDGNNHYRTCSPGRDANYWPAPQPCQVGLSCHPSATGNNIYCY